MSDAEIVYVASYRVGVSKREDEGGNLAHRDQVIDNMSQVLPSNSLPTLIWETKNSEERELTKHSGHGMVDHIRIV